jgi:large subunit ribosomal protein L2
MNLQIKRIRFSQKNCLFYNNFSTIKFKIKGLKNTSGRNNLGRITSYHKGGGHKQKYRKIDFNRVHEIGIIMKIEYDPNRTAHIAAVFNYLSNNYFYIIAPKQLNRGDIVCSGQKASFRIGHSLKLNELPIGCYIHNLSLIPFQKGQLVRAAGTYAKLIEKSNKFCKVELSSGEHRLIHLDCHASIGIVSNEENSLKILGKAGRARWCNRRPTVRGVAMNPIDHPHGGGEGKTSGGQSSVTPWGKPTKGGSTSKHQKNLIIVNRKNKY